MAEKLLSPFKKDTVAACTSAFEHAHCELFINCLRFHDQSPRKNDAGPGGNQNHDQVTGSIPRGSSNIHL